MLTTARFLIVRLSSIGDILHCTPVARVLKTALPDCHITWVVGEIPADMLRTNPYLDELYIWPRERWEQHLRRGEFAPAWQLWQKLCQDLQARKFDIVLDIHGQFLSGLITFASKAPRRIGMSNTRELNSLFMSEIAPSSPLDVHVIPQYLSVLKPLGITAADYAMTLHLPAESITFANTFLSNHGMNPQDRIIAFNPGTTWQAKNWPAEYYAAAIKALQPSGFILLCGGPADQALGESIKQHSGVPLINAIGQTSLLQLAALISRCTVLVTGDTGPLHMAIALGIPTVSIFGPTDPNRFGPLTAEHVVLEEQLDCRPCHKMLCPRKHLNCLYSLSPARVITAVQMLLNQQNDPNWDKRSFHRISKHLKTRYHTMISGKKSSLY